MDAAVAEEATNADQDGGVATLLQDGTDCADDLECASGHCNNELCCSGGDCCLKTRDCPASNGTGNVCDYAKTCQGSRGTVTCSDFRCITKDGTPNDTACAADLEADACGPYPSVYCSGQAEQQAPLCAAACESDSGCDRDARCIDGACVRRPESGLSCSTSADCAGGESCTAGACSGGSTAGGASASCTGANEPRDACGLCGCSKCEASLTACTNSGETTRDGLCKAVLDCVLPASCINSTDCQMSMMSGGAGGGGMVSAAGSYGCFGRECYCGTDNSCNMTPDGQCVRQIQAASGNTMEAQQISNRFRDPMFAVHYAQLHAECLQRSCRAECGL
jgi:hypothetical protein